MSYFLFGTFDTPFPERISSVKEFTETLGILFLINDEIQDLPKKEIVRLGLDRDPYYYLLSTPNLRDASSDLVDSEIYGPDFDQKMRDKSRRMADTFRGIMNILALKSLSICISEWANTAHFPYIASRYARGQKQTNPNKFQ